MKHHPSGFTRRFALLALLLWGVVLGVGCSSDKPADLRKGEVVLALSTSSDDSAYRFFGTIHIVQGTTAKLS